MHKRCLRDGTASLRAEISHQVRWLEFDRLIQQARAFWDSRGAPSGEVVLTRDSSLRARFAALSDDAVAS